MTENINENEGLNRRSVVKAAAWAAPVVAVAVSAPMAAASGEPEPEEASSIGATTTSPSVGNVGRIRPFGIDANGDDGFFPDGQTFTLTSTGIDFDASITSITGGTITGSAPGPWIITPNAGSTGVDIRFVSSDAGTYTLTSNGPIDSGQTWGGSVL